MLLALSEDTVRDLNQYIDRLLAMTAADGQLHDVSIGISTASTGLSIHCSGRPIQEVETRLHYHCTKRKYIEGANTWFGLALVPDGSVRFVAELTGPWKFDPALEAEFGNGRPVRATNKAGTKIGRNSPCPCGSGKKYKHCCIDR